MCLTVITGHTAEDDRQKLFIAARVAEELGVDRDRAASPAATGLAERVLDVEVTVTSERDVTPPGACRVITSVSPALEH